MPVGHNLMFAHSLDEWLTDMMPRRPLAIETRYTDARPTRWEVLCQVERQLRLGLDGPLAGWMIGPCIDVETGRPRDPDYWSREAKLVDRHYRNRR